MASLFRTAAFQSRILPRHRVLCQSCRRLATQAEAEANTPPLLYRLRKDLKTAMREKDTNRLNVLRGLINDITNSAKANNPVKTDMQILSLLRKRQEASKKAGEEFKAANRQDLVEKEESQISVLDEYAGMVETINAEDVREIVLKVIDDVKAQKSDGKINQGDVFKKLIGPNGVFAGKPVDNKEVTRIVKEALTMS